MLNTFADRWCSGLVTVFLARRLFLRGLLVPLYNAGHALTILRLL